LIGEKIQHTASMGTKLPKGVGMTNFLFSLFVLLHGLAHLVYTAMARGLIPATESQPDITGSSWLLSNRLDTQATRNFGAVSFAAIALLFAGVAGGLWLRQSWAAQSLMVAAFLSSVFLVVFWDGDLRNLTSKGIIGLLVNIAFIIAFYLFRYPSR
jgi:hypothetical protein